MTRHALHVLSAVVLIASGVSAQRGATLLGWNATTVGRGTADVALADTGAALVTNPAGLARSREGDLSWQLDATLAAYLDRVQYRDQLNPSWERSREFSFAPQVTAIWSSNDPSLAHLSLGIGLIHLEGVRHELHLATQDFMPPLSTERRVDYLHTGVHLGAAIRLSETFRLGASVAVTYSDLSIQEPLEIPVLSFQGASPLGTPWGQLLMQNFGVEALRIEGAFDASPALGLQPTLGAQWQPSDALALGVAVRLPAWTEDLEGDVSVDISRIFGEPDPVTFPDGFAVEYHGRLRRVRHPASVALGAAFRPSDDWLIACDLRYTFWSRSHRSTRLQLTQGNNPGFNAFVGSDSLDVTQHLDWQDQFSVALGLEWALGERWRLRAGGFFQDSPVRDASANPSAPAFAKGGITLGVGYTSGRHNFDLAWMHVFSSTRHPGDSVISSDLDGSDQRAQTDLFLFTWTVWF